MAAKSKARTNPKAQTSPKPAAERAQVALQATWQIFELFDALIGQGVALGPTARLQESSVIRALALRGRQLTGAAMSMLDDDVASIEEARSVVADGSKPRSQHREAAHG